MYAQEVTNPALEKLQGLTDQVTTLGAAIVAITVAAVVLGIGLRYLKKGRSAAGG